MLHLGHLQPLLQLIQVALRLVQQLLEAVLRRRMARAQKLVAADSDCLLILDNVDEESALAELLPARRKCRAVVTSRVRTLPGVTKQLCIDMLDEEVKRPK